MQERPILMNGVMVRALLDGSKMQTRRIVKPQPETTRDMFPTTPGTMQPDGYSTNLVFKIQERIGVYRCLGSKNFAELFSPYGQPGDRLWVRETFYAYGRWETRYSAKKKRDEWHFLDMTIECDRRYQYAADNPDVPLAKGRGGALPGWHTRPAIFMPRTASRSLLEVTAVRVERLQDISEADVAAEGWQRRPKVSGGPTVHADAARDWYSDLWESINGPGSWAANPWVWVVEFKRITNEVT